MPQGSAAPMKAFFRRHQRKWPWIAVVVTAFGFTTWNVAISGEAQQAADTAAGAAHTANRTAKALRLGLINSCEVNGNPLRAAVRGVLREGITRPDDPRLKELLPNVPQEVINRIVREGNVKKREALAEIQDVDCRETYSPRP